MRILVTGGAGFIGSSVADAFIKEGHEVAIIDNLVTGVKEFINPKAKFYEVDITDEAAVQKVFAEFKPEVVDHHAAQVDVRKAVSDPKWDAKTNIFGSLNLIEESIKNGVSKFIYANSGGAGYGNPDPKDLPCKEDSPIKPISPYGVSKTTVEQYLFSRQATEDLHYVALRYGNVFGPRQTFGEAGVCSIFTHLILHGKQPTIFGDGSQERDYCYIGDVVAANLLALNNKEMAGPYNVGSVVGTTTQQVFDAVKEATGYDKDPIYADERPGEIQSIVLDSARLQAAGWSPSVSFKDGIKETVKWMKENGK